LQSAFHPKNAFDHGNRSTCYIKFVNIEWDGEEVIANPIDQVPRWEISGGIALEQLLTLPRF
jgi:hypothetical protein